MRENVRAFADQLETTRQLVTLRRDVPVKFDLEACKWESVNYVTLQPIFARLGFRRLLEQAEQATGKMVEKPAESDRGERKYVLVDNQTAFADFLARLKQQAVFAFDTETTSLNPIEARLVGMSFCCDEGILFISDGNKVVAYCWTRQDEHLGSKQGTGHIWMMGVDPRYRGYGLGRAVLLAGIYSLRRRGLNTVELAVDSQNVAARRLYESVGFTRKGVVLWYERSLTASGY